MQSKYRIITLVFIIFSSFLGSDTFGQTYKNEVGAMAENDVYIAFMQDRYYTNGFFANFRHALKYDDQAIKVEKKIVEFEIGQKIYNPYSAQVPDLAKQDRPFTAYLYGAAGISYFYKNEGILKLNGQIGVMGPSALGEQSQKAYHNLVDIYKVMGWEYQLNDAASINLDLSYQHLFYRIPSEKLDISGASTLLLGNTFSGANAGILIRFGNINSFQQSSYANSRIINRSGEQSKVKREFFFFTKPQLNFAAYDATIQGGLFIKDKGPLTFGIKHWVYSQQVGVNFASKRWITKFIVTLKTKEIDGPAKAYHYGSVILAYGFN